MKVITRVRLHLLVCVVILVIVPASSGQLNSCQTSGLPSAAKALLDSKYSDWRPKEVSDLGADDKERWRKAHPKECPGIAIGHFEEPDRLSYAILLVPTSERENGYKILVLKKLPTGNAYTATLLDRGDYSSSGLVISKVPPGRYSDFEETASVRLNLDAVNVEWIEKGAVLYYWANGKYRTVQTSD